MTEVGDDYTAAIELSKERSDLESLVKKARDYQNTLNKIEETQSLLNAEDEEMRSLAEMEMEELQAHQATLEDELKSMLVPKDPRDQRNVIMEIRAGTGR